MSGVSTGSGTQSTALPLTSDQIRWHRFRRVQRAAKCTNSALNQRDIERFAGAGDGCSRVIPVPGVSQRGGAYSPDD